MSTSRTHSKRPNKQDSSSSGTTTPKRPTKRGKPLSSLNQQQQQESSDRESDGDKGEEMEEDDDDGYGSDEEEGEEDGEDIIVFSTVPFLVGGFFMDEKELGSETSSSSIELVVRRQELRFKIGGVVKFVCDTSSLERFDYWVFGDRLCFFFVFDENDRKEMLKRLATDYFSSLFNLTDPESRSLFTHTRGKYSDSNLDLEKSLTAALKLLSSQGVDSSGSDEPEMWNKRYLITLIDATRLALAGKYSFNLDDLQAEEEICRVRNVERAKADETGESRDEGSFANMISFNKGPWENVTFRDDNVTDTELNQTFRSDLFLATTVTLERLKKTEAYDDEAMSLGI
ncbi:hypothetical protein JCM5350_004912, partial [Sporobolomyces pararoseus]